MLLIRFIAFEAFSLFNNNRNIDEQLYDNLINPLAEIFDEIKIYGQEAEVPIINVLAKYLNIHITINYLEKDQNDSDNP